MAPEERDLIPFEPAVLRGERLLVLAPHPDDEVIGCGGLIAQHTAEGRAIRVLIATDGSAAVERSDAAYAEIREVESRAGLAVLGAPEPRFLRLRDRQLIDASDQLIAQLRDEVSAFKPDLIAVTSPLELHPDHAALCRALIDLLHSDRPLADSLPLTRIAFYEVSQPFRPNTLVDITSQRDVKQRALAEHRSQTTIRAYERFTSGLNRYRTMTLPEAVEEAEAYWVIDVPTAARMSWSEIAQRMTPTPVLEVTREHESVATIIRTRNRLPLLREAIESVQRNSVRPELIIVNDGGESPAAVAAEHSNVHLVDLTQSVGRSEAMNRGVAATSATLLTFLDDDDLFFPDHVETLVKAASRERKAAWYTDAVNVFMTRDENGAWREKKRLTLYGSDFDAALLAVDNFIPLITLCVRREDYLACGGFDRQFDLFEDWDFLIRLQRERGEFQRITRITCQVRHFEGSGSLAVAASADLARLTDGKKKIWAQHPELIQPEVLIRAIESQKRHISRSSAAATEQSGRAAHLEIDVARTTRERDALQRDTEKLLSELQAAHQHHDADLLRLESDIQTLSEHLDEHRTAIARMEEHLNESGRALDEYRRYQQDKEELVQTLYAEIARLNTLLETIYSSRSWKIHQLAERLSGRG